MRQTARIVTIVFMIVLISGCAGVHFYNEADLKTRTGIPIYGAKPYLLVARTQAKEKPVDISIVYLPDSQKVIYADPRSGFGSAKLALALANGQLTSFGQETDPKIAELLGSVGGLITARAGAEKAGAEAASIAAGIKTLHAAKSPMEIGKAVSAIAKDMGDDLKAGGRLKDLTTAQRQVVESAQKSLELAGRTLQDPTRTHLAQAQLEVVKAQAVELSKLKEASDVGTGMDSALQRIHTWVEELNTAYKAAQPEAPAEATFELYEIVQSAYGVRLVPVGGR